MLRPPRLAPLALAILALSAAPAGAVPIRVSIEGIRESWNSPPPVAREGLVYQAIIDAEQLVAQGIDFASAGGSISGAFGGILTDSAVDWQNHPSYEVSGSAAYTVSFDRLDSGPPAEGSPSVRLDVTLRGMGHYHDDGRIYGSWSGRVRATLQSWSAESSIPREVVDAFLDTSRLSASGEVTGGRRGFLNVALRLGAAADPVPVPIPEPSILAIAGLVLAAGAARRARARR